MDEEDIRGYVASQERFLAMMCRDTFDPEASEGNDNTLYVTMSSSIMGLSRRYAGTDMPIECFEPELHNIWYLFIISAQNIDAHHLAQDRLLRILTEARHCGVLRKIANPMRTLIHAQLGTGGPNARQLRKVEGLEAAETSQGCIWADLPFLVQDVRDAWKKLIMDTSASHAHCCNLTSAIARLAGSGVCGDAFSQCGLEIMKLAVETPLPPSSPDEGSSTPRLALVQIWLSYAGDTLLRLCLTASTPLDPSWALDDQQPIGPLAQQAGISLAAAYSRERFCFWKDRLEAMMVVANYAESLESDCATAIQISWNTHFGILTHG
ncbi:hypothetical protein F4777DRAFT_568288 [Nemania sp. FL0916]|nr:hypothetical protein F4777DRAFT_568288 [Nemania sp. FL0916]